MAQGSKYFRSIRKHPLCLGSNSAAAPPSSYPGGLFEGMPAGGLWEQKQPKYRAILRELSLRHGSCCSHANLTFNLFTSPTGCVCCPFAVMTVALCFSNHSCNPVVAEVGGKLAIWKGIRQVTGQVRNDATSVEYQNKRRPTQSHPSLPSSAPHYESGLEYVLEK